MNPSGFDIIELLKNNYKPYCSYKKWSSCFYAKAPFIASWHEIQ